MAVRWSEFVMRSLGTRLLDTSAESISQELHIKVLKGKEPHPLPPQALQHPKTLCQSNFKRHALDKDTEIEASSMCTATAENQTLIQ